MVLQHGKDFGTGTPALKHREACGRFYDLKQKIEESKETWKDGPAVWAVQRAPLHKRQNSWQAARCCFGFYCQDKPESINRRLLCCNFYPEVWACQTDGSAFWRQWCRHNSKKKNWKHTIAASLCTCASTEAHAACTLWVSTVPLKCEPCTANVCSLRNRHVRTDNTLPCTVWVCAHNAKNEWETHKENLPGAVALSEHLATGLAPKSRLTTSFCP